MNPKSKEALGQLVVLIIVVFIGWKVFTAFKGKEVEGEVKYSDCRQQITVQDPAESFSWDTYFKTFTCAYSKTKSGKIMWGECVFVDTEGGICTKAYVYNKKPEVVCTDPKYPIVGYDDLCHASAF